MGALQAYLGAFFFQLVGISIFSVRLGLVLLIALYLICMYALTSLLYSKKFALFTVALLSLGSSGVLTIQLTAIGGYPEILFFGALIFSLTSHLALTTRCTSEQSSKLRIRRTLAYGLLGLAMGLALWSDFLIIPCVAAAGTLIGLFCWRDVLRTWAGISLVASFSIGILPIILYNLSATPGNSSWNAVLYTASYSHILEISPLQRISGVLLISIPTITSVYPSCAIAEPLSTIHSIAGFFPAGPLWPCLLIHSSWVFGLVTLWGIAVSLAIYAIWKSRRTRKIWSLEERQHIIRASARLLILASAALACFLFAASARAGATPRSASRYLICVLFATPTVLWPLWHGLTIHSNTLRRSMRWSQGMFVVRVGLLLIITFVLVQSTIDIWHEIPAAQNVYQQQGTLVQDLQHIGATRIYSDYWTCGILIFRSDEHIICSNLDNNLHPGLDRYMPYYYLVRSTTHPAYVFLPNAPQLRALAQHSQLLQKWYQRYVFEGYVVYAAQKRL